MAEEEGLSLLLLWDNVPCPFHRPSSRLADSPALAPFSQPSALAKAATPRRPASPCRGGWWAPGSSLGSEWGLSWGGPRAVCEARSPPAPWGAAATALARCLLARALLPEDNI